MRYTWLVLALVLVAGFVLVQPRPSYQLVLDRAYQPIALDAVLHARDSIYLAVYAMKYYPDYPESNTLLNALCNASSRGVSVHVLADDEPEDNQKAIAYLRSCGVDARLDQPRTRLHAKFLVVDGELVLLGSSNWSYSSFNKNHEADLVLRDRSLASELVSYFSRLS